MTLQPNNFAIALGLNIAAQRRHAEMLAQNAVDNRVRYLTECEGWDYRSAVRQAEIEVYGVQEPPAPRPKSRPFTRREWRILLTVCGVLLLGWWLLLAFVIPTPESVDPSTYYSGLAGYAGY